LAVHLGQIQIELGVIALYFESFAAQPLTNDITLLGHSTEHAYIGKIKWILRLRLESAADVGECYALVPVMKVSETLCELREPYTSHRARSYLI
jgi:hypothetical protein